MIDRPASSGAVSAAAKLPPTAQARLARFAGSHARSSLLSVPSAAGLEAVGLEPVGEVMGATVRQLTRYTPNAVRPPSAGTRARARAAIRLSADPWMPYHFMVQNSNAGYGTVLARIADEARSLGADGVVDIRLVRSRLDDTLHEFQATGTAVRAHSRTHPERPFTTTLPGPDVAKLMLSGWVPVAAHVVVEVGLGWTSYTQGRDVGRDRSMNIEVDGYAKVMNRTWASARSSLRGRLAQCGADGSLLTASTSRVWLHEVALAAEVSLTATAVARFPVRRAAASSLTVLPLR